MLHNWTIGASGSGKTALNKLLCAGIRARGIKTAVLDPLRDKAWDADLMTHDREKWWRWVLAHQDVPLALFWEEATMSVDRQDNRFNLAALVGRHAGYRIYLISQRYKGAHPDVRDMCKERWMFNCDADDAQLLYRTYGHDALKELPNLPALHFFRARPMKPLQRGQIKFTAGGAKLFLKDL